MYIYWSSKSPQTALNQFGGHIRMPPRSALILKLPVIGHRYSFDFVSCDLQPSFEVIKLATPLVTSL